MTPLNHLQYGWLAANLMDYDLRERRMIMMSALLVDLDGIFMALSPILRALRCELCDFDLMGRVHHTFSHNIFFALMLGLAFGLVNKRRRLEIFAVCSTVALLQIVIDNLTNDPTWPIMYLWPASTHDFSLGNFSDWPHLRFLTVWVIQGIFSVFIWACTVVIYIRRKRTFLELASTSLDKFITDFMILPFRARCEKCSNRAHYTCSECGKEFCIEHSKINRDLTVTCEECKGK